MFITLALANTGRTGHTTSGMINRHRGQARQAPELGMQWLGALDELIPEFADCPWIAPNAVSLGSDENSHFRFNASLSEGSRGDATDTQRPAPTICEAAHA